MQEAEFGFGAGQVIMALGLLLLSVVVGGFLGYHLWMVTTGTTTYEGFKAREAQRMAKLEAETLNVDSIQAARLADQHRGPSGDQGGIRPHSAGQSENAQGLKRRGTTKQAEGQGGTRGDENQVAPLEQPGRGVVRQEEMQERGTDCTDGTYGPRTDGPRRGSARRVPGARQYDRGLVRNFAEVLFPNVMLARARKQG